VTLVSRACGLSRVTIQKGIRELDAPLSARTRSKDRRRPLVDPAPRSQVGGTFRSLVEPLTRGDPESPLRWTCKSTRTLAGELTARRHAVSHEKVAQVLRGMEYSLQGNRKTEEGEDHPHRDAQFRHIDAEVKRALRRYDPVLSVDTKKNPHSFRVPLRRTERPHQCHINGYRRTPVRLRSRRREDWSDNRPPDPGSGGPDLQTRVGRLHSQPPMLRTGRLPRDSKWASNLDPMSIRLNA
jgi:hypothetical protein